MNTRLVALGGGTGLASLLLSIKHLSLEELTAIVTVTDDGGSTGRLRREFGVPAMGDLRNCLVAAAEDERLLSKLFDYRFGGEGELAGHSLGNLFLTALIKITGDMASAVRLSGEILKSRAQVLPATSEDICLIGVGGNGDRMEGECRVTAEGPPRRVMLEPAHPDAVPEAVEAILRADIVLLGPGSLYTSIIPNLLVPDILDALKKRSGPLVWIANLMTQARETLGLSMRDHVAAIEEHAPGLAPDIILANDRPPSVEARRRYLGESQEVLLAPVTWDGPGRMLGLPLLYEETGGLIRHDRTMLARSIADLIGDET